VAAFASRGGSEADPVRLRFRGARWRPFFGNLASLIDIHVGETTPSSNSLWGHWNTLCVQSLCGTESGADASGAHRSAADDQQFHEGHPSGKTPTLSDCDPDDLGDS
jgi:hypothetical protein